MTPQGLTQSCHSVGRQCLRTPDNSPLPVNKRAGVDFSHYLTGGVNLACVPAVNFFVLVFGLPVLWVVNCGVFGAAFAVVPGARWPWRVLGALAGLLALTLLAWVPFAWQGTPADYPDPFCPANVPPWWPSWLPV